MDTAERKLRELEERVVGTVKTDAETDRRKPQERCGRPLRLPGTGGAMRLQGTLEVEGERGSQRTACVGTEDLQTPNFSLGSLLGFRATRPLLSATTCTFVTGTVGSKPTVTAAFPRAFPHELYNRQLVTQTHGVIGSGMTAGEFLK